MVEDATLPRPHLWLHLGAILFTFLSICTMAAVAAFQAKWISVSGGTGFVLFLIVLSFVTSSFLLAVPLIYDRWDKLKRPAQFLSQPRSTLILHGFGAILMFLAAMIVTISAWTESGCKDASTDPNESLGDDYQSGLKSWCSTKKASGIFDWFAFAAWAVLVTLAGLAFRKERRTREPGFIPPTSPSAFGPGANVTAGTYATIREDAYAGKEEIPVQQVTPYQSDYSYARPDQQNNMTRPSVDAYSAFDVGTPGQSGRVDTSGEEPSRTMQLAYNDPYSQIRASLLSEGATYGQPQALYGNGGLPHPPGYGYR